MSYLTSVLVSTICVTLLLQLTTAAVHSCSASYDDTRKPQVLIQCKCNDGCQPVPTKQRVLYDDGSSAIVTVARYCHCPRHAHKLRSVNPEIESIIPEVKKDLCETVEYIDEDRTRTPKYIEQRSCTEAARTLGCQNLRINMTVKYNLNEQHTVTVNTGCVSGTYARSMRDVLAKVNIP